MFAYAGVLQYLFCFLRVKYHPHYYDRTEWKFQFLVSDILDLLLLLCLIMV